MAHWEVKENGDAPKDAKVGDYVTTADGTWQIVDGASMTPEQRAAQGIGYNQSSNLFSKKVSNITTKDLSYQNYNTANQWKQQADRQAKQQLMTDYNKNLSNAMQSYNTNLAGLKNQATEAQENYEQNVRDAQEAAYYSGQASMAGAANRGMTNSAQSQAAANSLLYGVGNTMAELNSDKNMLLDKIYTNLNTLTQNYHIQLDELEKNKLAEELSMLSNNQLNYLAQIMDIDAFNADAYNNYRNQQMQMEWQSAENQKDRDHDIYMFGLQNGGYGGYGGADGNGKNGTFIDDKDNSGKIEYYLANHTGDLGDAAINELEDKYAQYQVGIISYEDWLEVFDSIKRSKYELQTTTPPATPLPDSPLNNNMFFPGGGLTAARNAAATAINYPNITSPLTKLYSKSVLM